MAVVVVARGEDGDPGLRAVDEARRQELTPFLARWLEVDEAAALEFVRTVRSSRPMRQMISLVRAMSRRDTGTRRRGPWSMRFAGACAIIPRELLGEISLKDREAVLAHVEGWNAERSWRR